MVEARIEVVPQGDIFAVNVLSTIDGNPATSSNSVTAIAAMNPRVDGAFVAQIPETSTRRQFTVTDQLGGVLADEYLKHEGDHIVINETWKIDPVTKVKTSRYAGAIVQVQDVPGDRFRVIKTLTHEECNATISQRVGLVSANLRYGNYTNAQKADEVRYAEQVWMQENQIYAS